MDFTRPTFYAAPFPSDDLMGSNGIDLSKLPNPDHPMLMEQALGMLESADGFARTGAIYFHASAALDPTSLPDLAGSVADGASAYVVAIDPTSPAFLVKQPIMSSFLAKGGPYGDTNLLALLPLQGVPLAANTRYAAIVTTQVRAASGQALAPSGEMSDLAAGHETGEYADAVSALRGAGVDVDAIAALAVFTTDDPAAELATARAALPAPLAISTPTFVESYPDFCVYQGMVTIPVLQTGTPPYTTDGGGWSVPPAVDHVEAARVFVTIPHAPMPAGGWPTVLFVRTGGGGDVPLVERGVCSTVDFSVPITPGTGPAMDFAQVGYAGIQVDGPLGGIRNTTNGNEDLLIFNVQNAVALRDNVRESAVELTWMPDAIAALSFDTSACTGASATASFDTTHLAMMGHSMGAWIAPLAAAIEPRFRALILSGAGGSFIANILDKQLPIPPAMFVAPALGLTQHGDNPTYFDPALTIVQWAAEPADPQIYDPAMPASTSILMEQGIVDHYILPSIADATSLSLGLDAADPMYDGSSSELAMLGQPTLAPLLPLIGRGQLATPVSGNASATTTRLLVQHLGDGLEDGHEVVFQTEPPKHQYRCFLASVLAGSGAPVVPPDGAETDPCN